LRLVLPESGPMRFGGYSPNIGGHKEGGIGGMVKVKKLKVPINLLGGTIDVTKDIWLNARIYMPGTKEHERAGLEEDYALVHLWRRKRP